MNRVTAVEADAETACRDIWAAAARLDIPLEYNMAGLTLQDRPDGSLGYTRDEFWRIAAEYPVKAIMGCDAHAPSELDAVPAIEDKRSIQRASPRSTPPSRPPARPTRRGMPFTSKNAASSFWTAASWPVGPHCGG